MFDKLTIKQLKNLIRDYNQNLKVIKGYSKFKKKQIVELLQQLFVIKDNKLELLGNISKPVKGLKASKQVEKEKVPTATQPLLFQGHKHLEKALKDIERKQNIPKQLLFARKIKGTDRI